MYNELDDYTKVTMTDVNKNNFYFHKLRGGKISNAMYKIDDYIGYCNSDKKYWITNLMGYLGDNTPPLKPSAFVYVANHDLTPRQIKTFNNKYRSVEPGYNPPSKRLIELLKKDLI